MNNYEAHVTEMQKMEILLRLVLLYVIILLDYTCIHLKIGVTLMNGFSFTFFHKMYDKIGHILYISVCGICLQLNK